MRLAGPWATRPAPTKRVAVSLEPVESKVRGVRGRERTESVQVEVEKLVAGATVHFPDATGPAEIVSVKPGEFWTFVYRDERGFDEITLSEEELGGVAAARSRPYSDSSSI